MSQENKQLVEKLNEVWMSNDIEELFSYYADDVVWTIAGEATLNGIQAIRDLCCIRGTTYRRNSLWTRSSRRAIR